MKKLFETIFIHNDFEYSGNPVVAVFRNTDIKSGLYIVDTGENAPDGFVLLTPGLNVHTTMQGRTMPNKSYLDKFFADNKLDNNEKFNYIASCYIKNGFRKGHHYSRPALVQNMPAPLIRSQDKIMKNADDYFEYGHIGDNFHGWLKSLGCWSVKGSMGEKGDDWRESQLTGDWSIAHEWIYHTNKDAKLFDRLCLERSDFISPDMPFLRFGSKGGRVGKLQNKLGLKEDGIFGFETLKKVIKIQEKDDNKITGVI
jgi:hypothetical protein